MKKILLMLLTMIVYFILVGVLGVALTMILYFIFKAVGLDVSYVEKGFIKYAILLVSWVLPYYILTKLNRFFKKITEKKLI